MSRTLSASLPAAGFYDAGGHAHLIVDGFGAFL
jgi:hypothetical protein